MSIDSNSLVNDLYLHYSTYSFFYCLKVFFIKVSILQPFFNKRKIFGKSKINLTNILAQGSSYKTLSV